MVALETFIERLSDEDLDACFDDIVEWRKEGTLPSKSIVRMAWVGYKEESGNDTYPIHMMPEAIFFEICKRKYEEERR